MEKDNPTIFHFCTQEQWDQQSKLDYYEDPSLHNEGFIHCSTNLQVDKVLKRYFKGQTDILLLHIKADALEAKLLFEIAPSDGDHYPHIYGPINKSAVVKLEQVL